MVVLTASAGLDVPAPVVGSITARVIAITEPSGEDRIAVGNDDVDVVDVVGPRQRHVVVDELAPRIHEGGDAFRVRHAGVARADHEVADGARVVAAERFGNAVGEVRLADAAEFGAGGVERRVELVVAGAVGGAKRDGGLRRVMRPCPGDWPGQQSLIAGQKK